MNTRKCPACLKILVKRENERTNDFNRRVYCNRSCAVTVNNKKPKRLSNGTSNCPSCFQDFKLAKRQGGGYIPRKYCPDCWSNRQTLLFKMNSTTKGELFARRKNWRSAHGAINKDARRIYRQFHASPHHCSICKYKHHAEVAHIKPIASFPDNALIGEINHISNLIALCPNCHWEVDNGITKLQG